MVPGEARGFRRCIGKSEFIYLFILNKDCVTFGKGKVEVKTWRCVVNLELQMQSEAAGLMKCIRKGVERDTWLQEVFRSKGYKENY